MVNIVLDVDVVVNLVSHLVSQEEQSEVYSLLQNQIDAQENRFWVVSAALPLISHLLGKEAGDKWKDFLDQVQVLSSYGLEMKESFSQKDSLATMTLKAVQSLHNNWVVLSEKEDFIASHEKVVAVSKLATISQISDNSLPFIDLQTQQERILPQIERNIANVLRHGKYIMGPEISNLEKNLCSFLDVKHSISCASGTDALLMALMAYEIGPGDIIFTSPFTFIATAEVVQLLGATTIFVDIDPSTYNISPEKLREAITQAKAEGKGRLRGIIPVDLFGLPADYDAIEAIAKEEDIFVLEDAAQSMGAIYKGRRACSFGHLATTSFFPAKPLGGYGDGGGIFTNDDALAEKLRSIRVHGQGSNKYDNVRIGINGRLDAMQAAVLLPKLEIFPEELEARQRVAQTYNQKLAGLVEVPHTPEGCQSAWAQYSVLSDYRSECQSALKDAGIPTAVYYPKPLHRQDAFSHLGYKMGDFPVTDAVSEKIFSLPMHPYLTEEQIDRIANVIRKVVDSQQTKESVAVGS